MCLQPRNGLLLSQSTAAHLQRIVNKQRRCINGQHVRNLDEQNLRRFHDIRASCIHCIKGPYMTFSQKPDTYATAITILDAFLWRMKVKETLVAIVGVACFSLAAKLTEDDENIPGLRELAECSGHGWSAGDISRMEATVMAKLGWDLPTVTYLDFLPHFADVCGLDRSLLLSDRMIILAERCLRIQSTVLIPGAVLALCLVCYVMRCPNPCCLERWSELISMCDINVQDLFECRLVMAHASSSNYKPQPLPDFCPKVRHGKKRFCRPSNKGSPKLSTIQEAV